jgi:hypothetical protein
MLRDPLSVAGELGRRPVIKYGRTTAGCRHRLLPGPVLRVDRHDVLVRRLPRHHGAGPGVDHHVIGGDRPADHRLAQAPRGADHRLVAPAVGGVGGEHDPGRVRLHHLLDHDGEPHLLRSHTFAGAVGHGAGRPEGGPAVDDGGGQCFRPADVQVGFLLPGKAGGGEVLGCGGGAYRHGGIPAAVETPVGFGELAGDPVRHDAAGEQGPDPVRSVLVVLRRSLG